MKYGSILADPPWPYRSPRAIVGNAGRGAQEGRAAQIIQTDVTEHYNVMTLEEIKKLKVSDLAEDDSHLYLWSTNSFIVEAHAVARSWGFVPKTILSWIKVHQKDRSRPSMKTGHWYRSASEHLIFAVRGHLRLNGPARPTAYLLPRQGHSRKPDFFYELIEEQSPGPHLELFARQHRAGWDCWGDEVNSTITFPNLSILPIPPN